MVLKIDQGGKEPGANSMERCSLSVKETFSFQLKDPTSKHDYLVSKMEISLKYLSNHVTPGKSSPSVLIYKAEKDHLKKLFLQEEPGAWIETATESNTQVLLRCIILLRFTCFAFESRSVIRDRNSNKYQGLGGEILLQVYGQLSVRSYSEFEKTLSSSDTRYVSDQSKSSLFSFPFPYN